LLLRFAAYLNRYVYRKNMKWIELLDRPQQVTCYYPNLPSLKQFALLDLILHANSAKIVGDLMALPQPLPERWQERSYTRAQCRIQALTLIEAHIEGTPRIGFDSNHCMVGKPVDFALSQTRGNGPQQRGQGVH
jgi:hypothetical protein